MNKLPDILKYLLDLIDNDEKRINITESPTNIFLDPKKSCQLHPY